MELAMTKHGVDSESWGGIYGGIPSSGAALGSALDDSPDYGSVSYRSVALSGRIIPVFITQDKSAWRLEELASQLRELLSKVVAESNDYTGLPDVLIMPPLPVKKTALRIIHSEPAQFRFLED